jgi:dihydrofolate reductase
VLGYSPPQTGLAFPPVNLVMGVLPAGLTAPWGFRQRNDSAIKDPRRKDTWVRKLVLQMGVSLDGLVARPGKFGAGGWGLPPEDPALKARKLDWIRDAGLHLMGRATYEEMAGFWPASDDEYAAPMNDIPKVVFSKTLTRADWAHSTIASGDLADEISALKRAPGKDLIAWGGAAFAQSLTRLRLVGEYRLVLQPVALGDGLPLFAGLTAPFVLDLIEAQAYADGAVLHVYRPAAG